MSPGNATYPCQYIYFIFVTLPTQKDGDVFCFMAIDGFSRYCFPAALTTSLSNQFVLQHIDAVLTEIEKRRPDVKPTLVMGYGDTVWQELTSRFETVNLIYDPETAYKIALPVVEEILSTGLPQK